MGHIAGSAELEDELHAFLHLYHIRGEWFRYEGTARQVADAIGDYNASAVDELLAPFRKKWPLRYRPSFEDRLAAIANS